MISFPALYKDLPLQELILLHIQSFINAKVFFLFLTIIDDNPKYLTVPNTWRTPIIPARSSLAGPLILR